MIDRSWLQSLRKSVVHALFTSSQFCFCIVAINVRQCALCNGKAVLFSMTISFMSIKMSVH